MDMSNPNFPILQDKRFNLAKVAIPEGGVPKKFKRMLRKDFLTLLDFVRAYVGAGHALLDDVQMADKLRWTESLPFDIQPGHMKEVRDFAGIDAPKPVPKRRKKAAVLPMQLGLSLEEREAMRTQLAAMRADLDAMKTLQEELAARMSTIEGRLAAH